MADSNLIKSGFEGMNLSENDCDGDCFPECLLLSEPLPDPYESNISLELQKVPQLSKSPFHSTPVKSAKFDVNASHHKEMLASKDPYPPLGLRSDVCKPLSTAKFIGCSDDKKSKYACDLEPNYAKEHLKACFSQEGPSKEYINKQDLAVCVEELLEFSLQETPRRKMNQEGVKTFDDCTAAEIIAKWRILNPKLDWLVENFNTDFSNESMYDYDIETVVDSIKKMNEFLKLPLNNQGEVPGDIARKNLTEQLCAQFAKRFSGIRHYIGTLKSNEASQGNAYIDQSCDKFKQVLSDFGSIVGVLYCINSECKETVNIFEVNEKIMKDGKKTKEYKMQPIICTPDLVFCSTDETITMPVEVHITQTDNVIYSNENVTDNSELNLNKSQERNEDKVMNAHHVFQHFALMVKKDEENTRQLLTAEREILSVGMFLYQNQVYLTKLKVPYAHMKSVTTSEKELTQINSIIKKIETVKETKFEYIRSNWSLDIWKGQHRNALLIFLSHYILAPIICVKSVKL